RTKLSEALSSIPLEKSIRQPSMSIVTRDEVILRDAAGNSISYPIETGPPTGRPLAPQSDLPDTAQPPKPTEPAQMPAQHDETVFIKDGVPYKGGVPYRPVTEAAERAHVPVQTLRDWIKKEDTKFAGQPLQTYYFLGSYFVSEKSIESMANRFVKWPSLEP